jgi:hypothetical protein
MVTSDLWIEIKDMLQTGPYCYKNNYCSAKLRVACMHAQYMVRINASVCRTEGIYSQR